MRGIETALDEADAERLARIALELDPTVHEYKRSEIGGVSWLAVTDPPEGRGPVCSNCGSSFSTRSSCPNCGAPRVGINTVSLPDRFTVAVTETDDGSVITPKIPGESGPGATAVERRLRFVEVLTDLRDEFDDVAAAERRLYDAEGGYVKETDAIEAPSRGNRTRVSNGSDGSTEDDQLVEIIKVWWILGLIGSIVAVILIVVLAV